ncbi:GDSL esterase/lipase At1g29670-like [Aristolochia californica]|uniref:GDSL esterase/lipase At1g29670-like n=1 Tax=Aristolochia californica TaxID=171875 RepID=UPI0035DDDE9B
MTKSNIPFLFLSLSLLLCASTCEKVGKEEEFKGMFVFGSSLLDNGNNGYTRMTAKASYLPYGIDFPVGTTGRFSNGKTIADWLGDFLEFPGYVPAFVNPHATGEAVLHGVNYAAAGSGALDATGEMEAMTSTSLNEQIKNFQGVTLPEFNRKFADNLPLTLTKYVFLIGTGGFDYLINYLYSHDGISLQEFTESMIAALSDHIKKLYELGARKFVLLSTEPLGCVPVVRSSPLGQGSCVDSFDHAAKLFAGRMQSLVDEIKPQLPEANLVFVNVYNIMKDIIDDPTSHGFNETSKPCCEVPSNGRGGYGMLCMRNGAACEDRSSHVFWDGIHPTQAAAHIVAKKAYQSELREEVYPINVKKLVTL